MRLSVLVILLSMMTVVPAAANDPDLMGVWEPVTYHIAGKDYPMEGLLMFSKGHFTANVRWQGSSTELDDMNAQAGRYRTEGSNLIFTSDFSADIHTGNPEGHGSHAPGPIHYNRGRKEVATYEIEGDQLIITFPGKNRYHAKRLE